MNVQRMFLVKHFTYRLGEEEVVLLCVTLAGFKLVLTAGDLVFKFLLVSCCLAVVI